MTQYILTKIYEKNKSLYSEKVELPEKLGEELFNDFKERENNGIQ